MFTYYTRRARVSYTMIRTGLIRICLVIIAVLLSFPDAFGQKKKEEGFGSFQPFRTSNFSKTNFRVPASQQSTSRAKSQSATTSSSHGYMPPAPAAPPRQQAVPAQNPASYANTAAQSSSAQQPEEEEAPAAQAQANSIQQATPQLGAQRQQPATAPGMPLPNYQLADNQSPPSQNLDSGFGREQRPMMRTPAQQTRLRLMILIFLICGALFIFVIAKALQHHMQAAEERERRDREERENGGERRRTRPQADTGNSASSKPEAPKRQENRDYSRFMPPELREEAAAKKTGEQAREKSYPKNDDRRYMPPELLEDTVRPSATKPPAGDDEPALKEAPEPSREHKPHRESPKPRRQDGDFGKEALAPEGERAHGAKSDITAPALDRNGLVDGKYKILSELGRGGMAVVYAATEVALDRKVALKKMRDEIKLDIRERKRFIKEARTTANLRHRHIVSIYTIIEEPDIYMVFELIEGKTLEDYLCKYEKLPAKHTMAVGEKILSALSYAHSKGVIHRDLKPSNVMVTAEGQVKVMDFGIARAAKDGMTRVTGTPEICGTLAYMAPEQEMGRAVEASDLFAFGVTMYEMATGELPFRGPNFLAQKEERVFEPPRSLAPDMPPEFAKIIERCLEPSTSARYKSAEEVLKDLKAVPL